MMKKLHLLPLFALLAFVAGAQSSFSDDFESYNANAGIGVTSPVWETWTGNVAGEDAPVVTERAHSGTKSLRFQAANANGGPSDVILKFGGPHETGDFEMEMWLYIVTGKGAYFNLQAENTPGERWAADFFFDKNGTLDVNGNGNSTPLVIDAPFPVGEWAHFKLVVDITSNKWEVFVNGASVGKFANPLNKIASIDLFSYGPSGSVGHFYVDDFAYSFEPLVLPPLDAAMFSLDSRKIGLAGMSIPVKGTIRNTGLNPITSFDVTMTGGATQSFSGLNVASLQTYSFDLNTPYTLAGGDQSIGLTISNINGGTDDNAGNNQINADLKGYVPAPGRAVVVEEATGTWCPWCVRGTVYMDSMSHLYPGRFIGIAVHNNDPMEVEEYDAGLTSFPDFTGFPSVVINRELLDDPSAMELPFLEKMEIAPAALLKNGATFDANTGELKISVQATIGGTALAGDYRLNAVIVEDGMSGTASNWGQANAYAGGGNGPMGGFENLPSTVPAAQMVYDHVGRAILGTFFGQAGSLPAALPAGSIHANNFIYNTLDGESDPAQLHIVGMLLGPDGEIVNAISTTIAEAVANGYVLGTETVFDETSVQIAPNPASDRASLRLALDKSAETSVRIFNAMGQLVATQHYGKLVGQQTLPLQIAGLTAGIYTVQVVAGEQTVAQKLVVK